MPNILAGPIPGENYTSDVKNYPWHRPPEFTNLDEAIEYAGKKLCSYETSTTVIALLKNKIPVTTVADIFLTSGIGAGKWTVDFALLMAGPISHIITLLAKGANIKYTLGTEDAPARYTASYYEVMGELSDEEERKGEETGSALAGALGGAEEASGEEDMEMGNQQQPVDQKPQGGLVASALNAQPTQQMSAPPAEKPQVQPMGGGAPDEDEEMMGA